MAEIYKFFNSAPGDERWYFASDFADYFGNVLSSGLLHKDGTPNLQVKVVEGELKTRVDIGEALMQGYQYENTLPLTLEHGLPEPNLDRIDRIVLRLNKKNDARYIKLFVKQGISAVNPSPPRLQRDNYVHELSLAQVRIRKNTSSLNPLDIKDERMIEDLCGIVYSLISVPTSAFYAEWNAFMESIKDESYASITMLEEVEKQLLEHEKNKNIHKTSQEIRSETSALRTEVVSSLPTSAQMGRIVFHNDTERVPKFKGYDGGKWV